MIKKEKKVNMIEYISDRQEKIKTLNPDIKEKLDMVHAFERSRGLMYKNIDIDINKELIKMECFATKEDIEIIKAARRAADMIMIDGWSIEYENHRIKIMFPDFPTRIYDKKISPDIDYLNKQLSRNIMKIINQLDPVPKMDKALVWIKYFMPIEHYDVDNNCYKPIIDGLTKILIESDDRTKLMYGFTGNFSKENPHTEVYIYDQNYIDINEIFDK